MGTQLNFNQKPPRSTKRGREKKVRGRRKTSTKMAMGDFDFALEGDTVPEQNGLSMEFLCIDETKTSPLSETMDVTAHSAHTGGDGVRRKSLSASTQFMVAKGDGDDAAPNINDTAMTQVRWATSATWEAVKCSVSLTLITSLLVFLAVSAAR